MKKLMPLVFALLSDAAISNQAIYTQDIKCGINGCSVNCAIEGDSLKPVASGSSVVLKSLASGVTIFEVANAMGNKSTVVVGSKGYICQVSGQKE